MLVFCRERLSNDVDRFGIQGSQSFLIKKANALDDLFEFSRPESLQDRRKTPVVCRPARLFQAGGKHTAYKRPMGLQSLQEGSR
jgi:hypothetical protein